MTNKPTKTISVPQLCYDVRGNSLRFRVKYANQESTFRATSIKPNPPEVWNKKTRAVEGSEAKTLTIREYDAELDAIYLKAKGLDQTVTAALLLEYLTKTRDIVNDRPNLVAAMDTFIDTKRTEYRNGNIIRITFKRYEVRRAYTIEFLQYQYNLSNIALDELKPVIGNEYESFLRNVKKLAVSTVNKDVEFLKAVLNYAILNEQIHRNVLSHWKRGKVTTEIRFLTHHEVNAIRNLTIQDSTLDSVRWIFVFIHK